VRLGALLSTPVAWLVVAYLGSLVALILTSFNTIDPFTTQIVRGFNLTNFHDILTTPVYRQVAIRSVVVAATVTVVDGVIAVPLAFYMAKVASPRWRPVLVAGVLMPLWASYLVKAYAWRAILSPSGGVFDAWFGTTPGFGLTATALVLAYLWLPYMVLPVFAGLERIPGSVLEASADLGGRAGPTFRRVVLPLLKPAIVAGSIFTFSLSLGDYITVTIVGAKTQLIGNVVYENFSTNLPLAAALTTIPVVIMLVYLLSARRAGAFESL
jgi:putative spermidine/putrescine transport system permease protein